VAPTSALAEEPRLAKQASPGLLTGPKRPAVSNATPDPLDQHEITITGRQSHPFMPQRARSEWSRPVDVRAMFDGYDAPAVRDDCGVLDDYQSTRLTWLIEDCYRLEISPCVSLI
jgi:hypothetical protein